MKTIEPQKAKFVAEIRDVRELRLIGNANLDFWNGRLPDKIFQAFQAENRFAEITIAATEPLAPTAANVQIGGRVMTANGRGIRNVLVTLTNANGTSRTVITGNFGYYRFAEIEAKP